MLGKFFDTKKDNFPKQLPRKKNSLSGPNDRGYSNFRRESTFQQLNSRKDDIQRYELKMDKGENFFRYFIFTVFYDMIRER